MLLTTPVLTCRFPVVLEHFAQHQLVGVQAKRVPEHADGHQEHVAVGALCLCRAGAIKIPLGDICGVGEGQREERGWEEASHIRIVRGAAGLDPAWSTQEGTKRRGMTATEVFLHNPEHWCIHPPWCPPTGQDQPRSFSSPPATLCQRLARSALDASPAPRLFARWPGARISRSPSHPGLTTDARLGKRQPRSRIFTLPLCTTP